MSSPETLSPPLKQLAREIATETGVSIDDVYREAVRDGLEAIKPRWEQRKRKQQA
jgi:transposase